MSEFTSNERATPSQSGDDVTAAQAQDSTEAKKGYAVGYGRPPVHSRFKPGQSGNPKGRPKGRQNAKTTVERVLNEKVVVRQGNKTRNMNVLEAMLHAHSAKAMKGDARSAAIVIGLVAKLGLLGDQEEPITAMLPEEDAAILDEYLHRRQGGSGPDNDPEAS
jgi:hypothetical protein